jgi:hypothetical protein
MAANPTRLESVLDVLVTCYPHAPEPSYFPEVRGHYLAKHLARSGLRAEFRSLPAPGVECRVLICSEYQCELEWFDTRIAGRLAKVSAARHFCLAEYSLGERDHFSREYLDWFGVRGGVLCQRFQEPLGPYEHWIGVGVDLEALGHVDPGDRDTVVFDFAALVHEPDASFDASVVDAVRRRLPACRLLGTGPPGSGVAQLFDDWIPYEQPHPAYIGALLPGAFAFVAGLLGHLESLGLAVAEAQCAGAAVVHAPGSVKDDMLCPEAAVTYEADDPESLASALADARARDPATIAAQASERFDYEEVVRRTRAAIGL